MLLDLVRGAAAALDLPADRPQERHDLLGVLQGVDARLHPAPPFSAGSGLQVSSSAFIRRVGPFSRHSYPSPRRLEPVPASDRTRSKTARADRILRAGLENSLPERSLRPADRILRAPDLRAGCEACRARTRSGARDRGPRSARGRGDRHRGPARLPDPLRLQRPLPRVRVARQPPDARARAARTRDVQARRRPRPSPPHAPLLRGADGGAEGRGRRRLHRARRDDLLLPEAHVLSRRAPPPWASARRPGLLAEVHPVPAPALESLAQRRDPRRARARRSPPRPRLGPARRRGPPPPPPPPPHHP